MKQNNFILSRFLVLISGLLFLLSGCSNKKTDVYEYVCYEYVDHRTYAILSCVKMQDESVHIPTEYNGEAVTEILERAFQNSHLEKIEMDMVVHIHAEAFENCHKLTSVDLGVVEIIDCEAFANCKALKDITIPKTVVSIESGAFLQCTSMKNVYFEGSPEFFGENVFDKGVCLYGLPGSSVEDYANKNGLEFIEWEL